jgi:hypothetical protein
MNRYRKFHLAKKRPTAKEVMQRFLEDCLQPSGLIEINQPSQVRTWVRAIKEGYITENGELLERTRQPKKEKTTK